jgi:hypothetical protein
MCIKARFAALPVTCLCVVGGLTAAAYADTIQVQAQPVADTPSWEVAPTLGVNSTGPVVVYTAQAVVGGALGPGHVGG